MPLLRRAAIVAPVSLLLLLALAPGSLAHPATSRSSADTARQTARVAVCPPRTCTRFEVAMVFRQKRPWTYHYQQISTSEPICTSTIQGNGLDDATLAGTGVVYLRVRNGRVRPGKYLINLAMRGRHKRSGVKTHTISGAECAPPAPAEPATGCGIKNARAVFPILTLTGSKLRLEWRSYASPPDFKDCPVFLGSSDVKEGSELPGTSYLNLTAPVSLTALSKGQRRHTFVGKKNLSAVENCTTLASAPACPEGITYDATASIEAYAQYFLKRLGP